MKKKDAALETQAALQQTQRLLGWSAYQESLKDLDRQVLGQFEATIASLRLAMWAKIGVYLVQFLVISVALFYSLRAALQPGQNQPWSWALALVSLVLLAVLLWRNPIQSLNRVMVDLARVQIILQGYSRQVNQVDAVFKQAFLENQVDSESLGQMLVHVQRVIDGNVESLLQFLEEMQL